MNESLTPIQVRNPANGEWLGEVPCATASEISSAISRARSAQELWRKLPVKERGRRVIKFRDAIRDHADELMMAISRENGKTLHEALLMEILGTTDLITYFSRRAHRILKPRHLFIHFYPTRRSTITYVPRGVVAILSPWNFPFAIPVGQVAMALLAGNAVVLKPSEYAPLIALKAKELFDGSGLPPDLFQVVTGDAGTGSALVQADVDQVIFTGSSAVGKRIAVTCAERLIPVTLELGGKAPAIVLEDADIERTASALVWGAFSNSGQVCASVERVYVHQSIHDALTTAILERVQRLRQGLPWDEVDVGAMTRTEQIQRVSELIDAAAAAGALILCGGQPDREAGQFFPPTVVDHCDPHSALMREEVFGPVMPIATFDEEDEAVRMANDSRLGLLAYVFSKNTARARRLAERIEAGTVMINDVLTTFALPETPWQGIKDSGLGIVHSAEGLKQLCELRHVHYDRLNLLREELWWYPYSRSRLEWFRRAYRWLYTWWFR